MADYCNAGQGWKWEVLWPLLPSEIQAHLSAFFVRMDSDADDSICWALSPNGMFTVRSAYDVQRVGTVDHNK